MVAAAIIGSSVLGAGASLFGSSQQAGAASRAANLLTPYSNAGQAAIPQLSGLLGLNGADMQSYLENLPGYQFTLGQGLESVQNGFAARGLGSSGAALKGAANYATGLANQTYGNQLGYLQNYANMGANAAAGVGSNLIQGANAGAAGLMGAANNIGNNALTYALLNNSALGGGGFGGYPTGTIFGTSAGYPTATTTPIY